MLTYFVLDSDLPQQFMPKSLGNFLSELFRNLASCDPKICNLRVGHLGDVDIGYHFANDLRWKDYAPGFRADDTSTHCLVRY